MAWQAQLVGGGLRALRGYLEQNMTANAAHREELVSVWPASETETLTPAQLRRCAAWLHAIRATTDPRAPRLRAFFSRSETEPTRIVARTLVPNEDEPSEARTKYLARRREKLQRLDEEMRYGHLVKNVQTTRASKELQRSLTSVKQHMSIGANMIVSRIVAFIVIYMVSRQLTTNETTRIVLGLGAAIGMMVIEMVLFIARAAKFDAIEREQKKKREGVF